MVPLPISFTSRTNPVLSSPVYDPDSLFHFLQSLKKFRGFLEKWFPFGCLRMNYSSQASSFNALQHAG